MWKVISRDPLASATFVPFPFQEEAEMEAAYITNNCIGLAGDATRLVNFRKQ
jgi:general L-amino acid transport system substrate-binding protein